jgi:uncharacterized membrane protein
MTLIGARPVLGLDAMTATGASFVGGGLLLAVLAAAAGGLTFPPTPVGVGLLALFALVPTALAYTAYFRGLGAATSPGTGAVLALLEPLTAAVLAAIVLGERLEAAGVVGALLLAVAVVLAARAGGRRPTRSGGTSRSSAATAWAPSCSCSAVGSGSWFPCRRADRSTGGRPADQPGECGEIRGRSGPAP